MSQVQERAPDLSEAALRLLELGGDIARVLVDWPEVRAALPGRFRLTVLPVREPEVAAHALETMAAGGGRRGWARVFALVDGGAVRFLSGTDGRLLAAVPLKRPPAATAQAAD